MLAMAITDADRKLAYLTAAGGEEMRELLDLLEPENPPGVGLYVSLINDDYRAALAKLDCYFSKATNSVQAAYDFGRLRQEPGERIREFEVRVRAAAAKCQFENQETRVREQLVMGTTDKKTGQSSACKQTANGARIHRPGCRK